MTAVTGPLVETPVPLEYPTGVWALLPSHETHWGGYFLRTNFSPRMKIRIFERRFKIEDCLCFNGNPIKSKLLGRIAAEAQQQQRAHPIDR